MSSAGPGILRNSFRIDVDNNDDDDSPSTSLPSVSQLSDEVFEPPRPKFRAKPTREAFMSWTIVPVKRPFEEVIKI